MSGFIGSHSAASTSAEEEALIKRALAASRASGAASRASGAGSGAGGPGPVGTARVGTHSAARTNAEEKRQIEWALAASRASGAGSGAGSGLPPGWSAERTDEGEVYYEHTDANIPNQWEVPTVNTVKKIRAGAGGAGAAASSGAGAAGAGGAGAAGAGGAGAAAAEHLTPNQYLERYPRPATVDSQAEQVYGDYLTELDNFYAKITEKIGPLRSSISITEIIPHKEGMGGLFHGNALAAATPEILKYYNIRLIIQATGDRQEKELIRAGLARMDTSQRPLILELDMEDNENQSLDTILQKSLEYLPHGQLRLLDLMLAVRNEGSNILVNCSVGMSRSTAVVLMHLMDPRAENMDLLDAWRFLKYKRPVIFPNYGFIQKLRAYEQRIRGTNTVSDELIAKHSLYRIQEGGKKRRSLKTRKRRHRKVKKTRRRTLASSRVKRQ